MESRHTRRTTGSLARAIECLERRACPAVVSVVGLDEFSSPVEIAENGPPLTITLSLSAAVNRPVQVSYLLSGVGDVKATPRADVRVTAGGRSLGNPMGTLTFRPGQTSQQIQLAAVNDTLREGDEGLRVQLFRPRNATIDPAAMSIPITIRDDDGYSGELVVAGASRVAEGSPVRAHVQLSAPAVRTEVFYVTTADGTAGALDYRPFRDLPVTILRGQSRSEPFTINTVLDEDDETDEFFILTARHKDPSFPPIDMVGVTIAGNGPAPPPVLSVADVTVTEGNLGLQSAVFTIRLSAPSLAPVTVGYATADGTALSGEDYVATSGSLTFKPGQITKTVVVSVIGDTRREENETFQFVLSNPSGAALQTGTATGTILDDEPKFEITFVYTVTALGPVPAEVQAIAAEAAARWSRIIVGDLPDVTIGGRTIDDLEMTVQMGVLGTAPNGPTGPLANARPTAFRDNGQGIPYSGITGLNPFYSTVNTESERLQLLDTITHEIGHALGYTPGAPIYARWIDVAAGTFIGPNALREYRAVFGQPNATGVPLDGTTAHWSEQVFGDELMSPIASVGREFISRVTVGALEDLGYTVDYAAAEPYVPPQMSLAAAGVAGGGSEAAGRRDASVGRRVVRMRADVASRPSPVITRPALAARDASLPGGSSGLGRRS